MKRFLILCAAALALTACGTAGPKAPTGVKVGKPYSINGQTYYPEYDPHYDRSGTASWYGPGFHGKSTANGEKFDKYDLTAAHPTLPMPSLVRVTNLENGKSAVVRINDRGPFKDNRLIDLSKASADKLGVIQTGLARVRVQYLKEETEQYWASAGITAKQIQFAKNDPYAPDKNAGARGGLDGVVIARDDDAGQIADAAPMMAVTTAELEPSEIKVAPQLPPRGGFISDANASEFDTTSDEGRDEITAENEGEDEASPGDRSQTQPEIVHLYSGDRKYLKSTTRSAQGSDIPQDAPFARASASAKAAPSAGEGEWYVQAGSFASIENARKLVKRIGSAAQAAISPVQVSGKTWHRVRFGPYSDHGLAEDMLERVASAGASGARIIKE